MKKISGLIVRFCYLVGVALSVYILGWPWLWSTPIKNFSEYLTTQFTHLPAESYIFHTIYSKSPWWYTGVIFLSTTPAFVLSFFVYGSVYCIKKGSLWYKIILANAFFPLLFFSLPGIYRYDWVRLFLAAFPFVCIISVYGMFTAIHVVKPKLRRFGKVALLIIWLVTVYVSVIRIHPWESSYSNEFVGGIRGANALGFESEYWGNSYKAVLPWMNAHKDAMMCVAPTTNSFYYYQAMGQIESGVVFNAGFGACRSLIVLMRQGAIIPNQFIDTIIKTKRPIYTHSVDGVILTGVYDIGISIR